MLIFFNSLRALFLIDCATIDLFLAYVVICTVDVQAGAFHSDCSILGTVKGQVNEWYSQMTTTDNLAIETLVAMIGREATNEL